jgi:hypothetical protein
MYITDAGFADVILKKNVSFFNFLSALICAISVLPVFLSWLALEGTRVNIISRLAWPLDICVCVCSYTSPKSRVCRADFITSES